MKSYHQLADVEIGVLLNLARQGHAAIVGIHRFDSTNSATVLAVAAAAAAVGVEDLYPPPHCPSAALLHAQK